MGGREKDYDPIRTLRRMRNAVVAVLLAVLAWLLLSRAYAATRADNALDELYYSTLDCGSEEAFLHGHYSPTVLASALSAYKADPPRNEGLDKWYCSMGRDELQTYGDQNKYIYLYGYRLRRVAMADGWKYLSWYIEDGGERGHSFAGPGRKVVFQVAFFPESLGGARSIDYDSTYNQGGFFSVSDQSVYHVTWVFDADSKTFSLFNAEGPLSDELNGGSAYSSWEMRQGSFDKEIFALNGADPMLMADLSRQAIRDVVLRGYLEGAGLSDDEVESRLSEVDPVIDGGVDQAKEIYRCYQGVHADG